MRYRSSIYFLILVTLLITVSFSGYGLNHIYPHSMSVDGVYSIVLDTQYFFNDSTHTMIVVNGSTDKIFLLDNVSIGDDMVLNYNHIWKANLSNYCGDNLVWDSVNLEFDGVVGGGVSNITRSGTTLYSRVDGDDMDINGTISGNDIGCGNILSTAFFNSNFVGGVDMTGDPWFLSGTDLEINQDLKVNGYILSDLLPNPTLTFDLGSGSNRWEWLYVGNVSSDLLNATYGIGTLGDIYCKGYVNASYFVGDGSGLTGIVGGGVSNWTRSGTTLYTRVDGDDVDVNGSISGDVFSGNGNSLVFTWLNNTFPHISYVHDQFASNSYLNDTFTKLVYAHNHFVTNSYVNDSFIGIGKLDNWVGRQYANDSFMGIGKIDNYVGRGYANDTFVNVGKLDNYVGKGYVNDTFAKIPYVHDHFVTNSYANATWLGYSYLHGKFASNSYLNSSFPSFVYVHGEFVSNDFVNNTFVKLTKLDNYVGKGYVNDSFIGIGKIDNWVGKDYANNTFDTDTSDDIIAGDTFSGDVTGTLEADGDTPLVVVDNSHNHDTTTISGLDISSDTNLAVTAPIVLTDDTLSHSAADGYKHVPSGGSSAQLLQYGGSAGTAKWITLSSDATIADGGAVTVVDDSHNHVYSNIDATTSSNWATRVSDETGSGKWVFATSPTLITPTLGVASATTLDTGFGANELYDMNQHVLTTSDVVFDDVSATGKLTTNRVNSSGDLFLEATPVSSGMVVVNNTITVNNKDVVLITPVNSLIFQPKGYSGYGADFNLGGGIYSPGMGFWGGGTKKCQISVTTGRLEGPGLLVDTIDTGAALSLVTTPTVSYDKKIFTSNIADVGLKFYFSGSTDYYAYYQSYDAVAKKHFQKALKIDLYGTRAANITTMGNIGVYEQTPDYAVETMNWANNSGKMRANDFVKYSDGRVKDVISIIPESKVIDVIMGLKPVMFYWKDSNEIVDKDGNVTSINVGKTNTNKIDMGLVAQDAKETLIEAFGKDSNIIERFVNTPKDMNTSLMGVSTDWNPFIIRMLQIQQNKMQQQQIIIDGLHDDIQSLNDRVKYLEETLLK